MLDLRALLEMRQARPLSFSPDGERLLVASNMPGTQQLYVLPARGGALEQLTSFQEPVTGQFLPDGRVLLEVDEGGNERTQLYVLDGGETKPLVVDERYIHRTPHARGTLLAYATNRRNDVDFDVVVRDLRSGEEQTFELTGNHYVEAVSPDGRWIAVDHVGERTADNDLLLIDVERAVVTCATPHDEPAEFYSPVWAGGRLVVSTNDDRDTFAIVGDGEVVHESRWDLGCAGD